MKNAVRLCAVLAVLASASFAKPATAVVNDNGCVPLRCDLFCRENGHASGRCVWGVCRCF
jgi:hypothetical protein